MRTQFLALLIAAVAIVPGWTASTYLQERPGLIGSNSRDPGVPLSTLDLLRYLIYETKAKMVQNNQRNLFDQTRKRAASSSCLFNAGLAHNCDYRDVIGAVNEVNHWGSDLAPGRRKREIRPETNFPLSTNSLYSKLRMRSLLNNYANE